MGGGPVRGGQVGGSGWMGTGIEAFVKIQKKNFFFGWGGGGRVGGGRVGGQGGCERRSKVFVKIQKKKFLGGGGVRVGGGGVGGSDQGLEWGGEG